MIEKDKGGGLCVKCEGKPGVLGYKLLSFVGGCRMVGLKVCNYIQALYPMDCRSTNSHRRWSEAITTS